LLRMVRAVQCSTVVCNDIPVPLLWRAPLSTCYQSCTVRNIPTSLFVSLLWIQCRYCYSRLATHHFLLSHLHAHSDSYSHSAPTPPLHTLGPHYRTPYKATLHTIQVSLCLSLARPTTLEKLPSCRTSHAWPAFARRYRRQIVPVRVRITA
jgi:hypothetical protein